MPPRQPSTSPRSRSAPGSPSPVRCRSPNGQIVQSRIGQSSGYPALDEAALRVVEIMRFKPALNRDRAVRVIVNLPIQFEAR